VQVAGRYLLEISVESAEAAAAAERGGADRLELCAELAVGGVTPGEELMRAVRAAAKLPIFVMIRPRAGNFTYTESEIAAMRASIELAKQLRMDGVVLGLLTNKGRVDVARTKELVEAAKPSPVTFHRAFDECADQVAALEDVIRTGAVRVLTSGGAASAVAGAKMLARLVAAAGGRIIILPGAGIHAGNIAEVARATRAREFHSGLSSVLTRDASSAAFQAGVSELAQELREIAPGGNTAIGASENRRRD
jgi:copper homeostasis protein